MSDTTTAARVYYRADDTVALVLRDAGADGDLLSLLPAAPAGFLVLDAATNGALLDDLVTRPATYRVVAGTLTQDGLPVPIAAPSRLFADRQRLGAFLERLEADQSLTAAELRVVLRVVLRSILREARP